VSELLRTPFPERAGAALKDAFLQQALTIATTKFIDMRRAAFEGFPQGDALRDRARGIKEATLQRLDHYLGQLADNVERLGGHVHWAGGAEEAREIVLRLCRDRGVKMAVKSKSMATEEIDLNEALEHAGDVRGARVERPQHLGPVQGSLDQRRVRGLAEDRLGHQGPGQDGEQHGQAEGQRAEGERHPVAQPDDHGISRPPGSRAHAQ